tara:strand:- start:943 stop:1926 length:984 start_codon:yes stop_codon:yes gene_type:complete
MYIDNSKCYQFLGDYSGDISKCKNMILAGGAAMSVTFLSLFKILKERNIHKNIKNILGLSAGALMALFFIFNFTEEEVINIATTYDYESVADITVDNIINFTTKKGVDSVEKHILKIRNMFKDKCEDVNKITFKYIYERFGINLIIVITNIMSYQAEYYDYYNSPEVDVFDILKCTIAFPFYFEPVEYNGNLYIDGAFYNNLPLDYFEDNPKYNIDETFSIIANHPILKINSTNIEDISMGSYFHLLYTLSRYNIDKLKKYNKYIIHLCLHNDKITSFKHNITLDELKDVLNISYVEIKKQLEHADNYQKKIKILKQNKNNSKQNKK